MEAIIYSYFVVLMLPLWLGAGLADWACHRKERIEKSTGPKEAILHLLMLVEIGVPVLYCLFFEINATAILICAAGLVLHAITAWSDVRYAYNRRRIGPTEQHVHSFLEILPLLGLFCIIVLNTEQFLALLGFDQHQARFALRLKAEWPFEHVAIMLGIVMFVLVIPYLEEITRCLRYRTKNRPDFQRPSVA